jgi:hypothetical protein
VAEIKIDIVNESSVVTDAQLAKAVAAVQTQVHRDFAPAWGIDADLTTIPKGKKPRPKTWWIGVFDDSDKPGALGYHDLTNKGLPLGYVFAKSDIESKSSWSNDISHEVLEMLGDPDINLGAYREEKGKIVFYAYEVCDPCEDDPDGYLIDGILVSDFVFPAWFEGFRKEGSTQFDFRKLISKPFQLLPNGYIGMFDPASHRGWHQVNAELNPKYLSRPKLGSRRQRRNLPRDEWQMSRVK